MAAATSKPPDPFAPGAGRGAAGAIGLVLVAALVGAAVRLLPWVLDPNIAWATLAPFARSLLVIAVEAALLTGWPVGWALAAARLVERGEARVLASLGESPAATMRRLARQAIVLAVALAATSFALGREAAAPGRVVDALLREGRASCAREDDHATRGVPFVSATWLCAERHARLVGRAPMGGVVFTAADAHVSDDLRRIELTDARLTLAGSGAGGAARSGSPNVRVAVDTMVIRGLAPWTSASSLPPWLRAGVVTASALAAALAAVFAILRARRRIGGVAAAALGSSGALAALVALRGLEVRAPEELGAPGARVWFLLFALVPLVAAFAVWLVSWLASVVVTLLPDARRAGSK